MHQPDSTPEGSPSPTDDFDLAEYDAAGETGGEIEAGSDDPFFVSKKAAAVFKHKLLKDYFPKFAGKAGSTEADRRLVYVDTHAGRGSYDDGTAGSPLLIAQNVAGMTTRQIDCFFIEKRPSNHAHLRRVLAASMPATATWDARLGDASAHLDDALSFAGNSPLFMFIDPYGLGPTFPEVIKVLRRPRRGYGRKTEVLLNFISSAFGRAGAYIRLTERTQQQNNTLDHLDAVLGGPWWRPLYLTSDLASHAVRRIAEGYAKRVQTAAPGYGWTLIPVRDRAHNQPLYWLLHFTAHSDGEWWIREASSTASAEWRRHCSPPPADDDATLFPIADPFPEEEARREATWVDTIEANARAHVSERREIRFPADASLLFGETLGLARAKHLRQALARLHGDGLLVPKPMAKGLERYAGHRP